VAATDKIRDSRFIDFFEHTTKEGVAAPGSALRRQLERFDFGFHHGF
jgi:hypothetical protein